MRLVPLALLVALPLTLLAQRPIGRRAGSAPRAAGAQPAAGTDSTAAGIPSSALSGFRFRGIGPAFTSGRIGDIVVHPDKKTWYLAVSSGGVWKTENAGTTWAPIFDGQSTVFSIGSITMDPKDPNVLWVGTGEGNSQRSVAYGDGVYKSEDGGRSWTNMGLKTSEHIAKIVVDPRNSDVVYVAAQGPLWSEGGERGLYKTTDGGKTWAKILSGAKWAGVTDVDLDPRNPDIILAATWQRHRHVWGYIGGGPESGLHRSTDGGKNWKRLGGTLPDGDVGRYGIARSPADPNVVYAIVDASNARGGTFRSNDGGMSWNRVGSYTSFGLYYQELFADPKNTERVYSVDVLTQVSEDGGRTFRALGEANKHVDNHAVWIDPDDTEHLLIGSDGGLYESFDRGQTYTFFANLPVTQFYKVEVDQAKPFYNIYGGTQDNYSFGGPSRTNNDNGIRNSDWFVTQGGDGFQTRVDPTDNTIIYAQSQNGGLSRFNKRTGESVDIVPQPEPGEPASRWNWDSPLIISPFSNTRLYFASQRLWRSDDRGNSWRAVSPDLTRNIDRTTLKIQGRSWSVDAVGKNSSTSLNGNITALAESKRQEGLLYVGTDDGHIQVSEDGGQNWRKSDSFTGVPDTTFVAYLTPSRHDANVVYAALQNHKRGDFKPYVLKSSDKGRSWALINGNLPTRGSSYVIVEDFLKPELLFVGTEFGLHVSFDGGTRWQQMRGGLPPIAVKDIAIQEREHDLVVATFGRGFYVLDDYSPLRALAPEALRREATIFPVKTAQLFLEDSPLGGRGASFQGAAHYFAPNPAIGATITFNLRTALRTKRAARQAAETPKIRAGEDVAFPGWEALKAEEEEEAPVVFLVISEPSGGIVRRIPVGATAGTQRVTWNLRWPATTPVSAPGGGGPGGGGGGGGGFGGAPSGPYVVPGSYRAQLVKRVDGVSTPLGQPVTFEVATLHEQSGTPAERARTVAFQRQVQQLQRAVLGANALAGEANTRIESLKRAIDETPGADNSLSADVRTAERKLDAIREAMSGDNTRSRRSEPNEPSLLGRMNNMVGGLWSSSLGGPTAAQTRAYEIVSAAFPPILAQLKSFVETDLKALEVAADRAGVPWTSGRIPNLP